MAGAIFVVGAVSLTPYGCKQNSRDFFSHALLEFPPNLRKKSVYERNFASIFVRGYLIKIADIVCS